MSASPHCLPPLMRFALSGCCMRPSFLSFEYPRDQVSPSHCELMICGGDDLGSNCEEGVAITSD
jgi:hypothetical protein